MKTGEQLVKDSSVENGSELFVRVCTDIHGMLGMAHIKKEPLFELFKIGKDFRLNNAILSLRGAKKQHLTTLSEVVKFQYDGFGNIINKMKNFADSLEVTLNGIIDYDIPLVVMNKMNTALEDIYMQRGEEIENSIINGYSRDIQNFTPRYNFEMDELTYSTNSLKLFAEKRGAKYLSNTLMRIIDTISMPQVFSIEDATILIIFAENMNVINVPDKYTRDFTLFVNDVTVSAINSFEETGEDTIVVGRLNAIKHPMKEESGYYKRIIVNDAAFEKSTIENLMEIIIGTFFEEPRQYTDSELRISSTKLKYNYDRYIRSIEVNHEVDVISNLTSNIVDFTVNYIDGLTEDEIKKINPELNKITDFSVRSRIINTVNGLTKMQMSNRAAIVEKLFLEILYPNTQFSEFYTKLIDMNDDNVTTIKSEAMFYLTMILVYNMGLEQ